MELSIIRENVEKKKELLSLIKAEIGKKVIGQQNMIEGLLLGIFTNGHILLEGVPGLAKSLVVNTFSEILGLDFKRIQFTPDLLPADIIGTEIYNQKTGDFVIKKGPIFGNIILADEINRAPAKVQSALLEAMQERQITIGNESYRLDEPFLVLATQNPIEQEGTYTLPEAQQDRFMFKIKIDYPSIVEEKKIMDLICGNSKNSDKINKILDKKTIYEIRDIVDSIYVDENVKDYIIQIVFNTRKQNEYILSGASPRASINLLKAAKGRAFLNSRPFVTPDDVKDVVYDVLRHRIILSYEAEAEEISVEKIIETILENTKLP